jgi:DnaJ family protein C protein 28
MPKAEDQIRKAMEEGKFDNLPGKGKPLPLDENPYENPAWQMAHHILKTGGFTLPWMETRREIEEELAAARAALGRAYTWRQAALAEQRSYSMVETEWKRAVDDFRQKIAALNKRIFSYNLEVPSEQFQLLSIHAERDLETLVGV